MTRAQNVCYMRLSLHAAARAGFAVCLRKTEAHGGGGDTIAQDRQKLFSSTMHGSEYCFSFSEQGECVRGIVIPEWSLLVIAC